MTHSKFQVPRYNSLVLIKRRKRKGNSRNSKFPNSIRTRGKRKSDWLTLANPNRNLNARQTSQRILINRAYIVFNERILFFFPFCFPFQWNENFDLFGGKIKISKVSTPRKKEETKAPRKLWIFFQRKALTLLFKDKRSFSTRTREKKLETKASIFFFFFWNEKDKNERKKKDNFKRDFKEGSERPLNRWPLNRGDRGRSKIDRSACKPCSHGSVHVLALKAGQDRLSGTERVSLKRSLGQLVRLSSGQLAAKSETRVARLLQLLWPVGGLYRPGDAAGPRRCRCGRVLPRLVLDAAAVHAATL